MDDDNKKPHRKRQAGRKAEKKKKKTNSGQPNPKAFAYNSARSAEKAFHRTADVLEKKHHPLVVDRKSDLPPPVVVAVVGPPKVGKTTLIQALVRQFVRKRVNRVQGPITVISGKGENKTTKRLTFVESLCDVHCMVDVAKVADLVILMMNGNKKHQMETFEFLTLCRAHNFTKILGVVTHLDLMKTNKVKKKKKKMLKTRFWSEVCQGAKMHFLDGFDKGSYMKNQVRLLSHSISRFKYAPRTWLTSHPYIIADRMEDVTNPEDVRRNPVAERTVCLFGYVRGTFFNSRIVHIPGCGDYAIEDISIVPDPCPPVDQLQKRSLNDRERRLYAPMSGIGGILYDRDAIYMDIGGSHALRNETARKGSFGECISSLKNIKGTIDEKIASIGFGADASDDNIISSSDSDDDDNDDDDDGDDDGADEEDSSNSDNDDDDDDMTEFEDDEDGIVVDEADSEADEYDDIKSGVAAEGKKRKRVSGGKDGVSSKKLKQEAEELSSTDGQTGDASSEWKKDLKAKGIEAFSKRNRISVEAFVYNPPQNILPDSDEEYSEVDLIGGLFVTLESKRKQGSLVRRSWVDNGECAASSADVATATVASEADLRDLSEKVRDCFVTGKFTSGEDAESALKQDDELFGDSDDYGDDESNECSSDDDDKDEDDETSEEGDNPSDDEESRKPPADETPEERRERRMKAKLLAKKKRQRALLLNGEGKAAEKTAYEQQREEMQLQAEMNRNEFVDLDPEARVKIEGFRPGLYVRVELKIDSEFVRFFDPRCPVILGGILPKEDELGFVTAKIQIHRYQKLPLRDRDPALISVGWRRIQSVVLFSAQQDNLVSRTLKQARPRVSCMATFWGPVTPQGTSVLMYSTDPARKFRITAAGTVSKQDKTLEITKKVPLVGFPFKIFNKTAFIQGMFNSSLEVAKFEHAAIQTVSGIRGTVKKTAGEGPPGTFRATFEDKILKSDLVILKATTMLDKSSFRYWQSVPNYLLPLEERKDWVGMKLRFHLEQERNVKRTFKPDSVYRPIIRRERQFRPLSIPAQLQKDLPYKDKTKVAKKGKTQAHSGRIAVVKEPEERRRDELLKRITAIDEQKRKQKWQEMRVRAAAHEKKMATIEDKKKAKEKVLMKKAYAKAGQANKKKQSKF